ncbi:hypothetical protein IW261DRAFT_1505926 [Armillaria novae-zelandiae]|uniref:Uncharacterized protein n=1 Tax=Armillaria novae-zelandiae TaxID=153914 RepID=A0AA39NW16_9AGAR|nr:hypothetical protein IW261DRAFT_1505926 [Armillaria novae-zelandiae]
MRSLSRWWWRGRVPAKKVVHPRIVMVKVESRNTLLHPQRFRALFIRFSSPLAAMHSLLLFLSFALRTLCISALNISAPDHALQNQNVTVNLTFLPGDPPSFFLTKLNIDDSLQVSRNVTTITGFTANTAVNITFHNTGTFRVLACNISDPKNLNFSSAAYFLSKSQKVQVQVPQSPDGKQHNGHGNSHGNEDDSNHSGNSSSGRSGSTQTINAVPLASPASSNVSSDDSSTIARTSLPSFPFCVLLGLFLLFPAGPI